VADDGTFGFDELTRVLTTAMVAEIKDVMPKAHARVGEVFVKMATEKITRENAYAPNSALTTLLKGSTMPLVGGGPTGLDRPLSGGGSGSDLVGSLAFDVKGWRSVILGIQSPQLPASRGGRFLYEVLHNGATWEITDKQRRAIFHKLREARGSSWVSAVTESWTGPGKTTWTIPPRPFLAAVFRDPKFLKEASAIYHEALQAAVRNVITKAIAKIKV
jgi:hypothetical protein